MSVESPWVQAGAALEWLRVEVARFAYKPGYELTVRAVDSAFVWGDPMLVVTFTAPDARAALVGGQRPMIRLEFRQAIPFHVIERRDSDLFALWLSSVLIDLETHEAREWIRRDGVILDDPHKEETT